MKTASFLLLPALLLCGMLTACQQTKAVDAASSKAASASVAAKPTPTPSQLVTPTPLPAPKLKMEVTGYFPSWAKTAANVPYEKLDQIYYSFLLPTPAGDFEPIANPDILKDLVTRSHKAGVKVSIAVGGAKKHVAPAFTALSATPETRAAFVKNLIAFVDAYKLDGVDIDWEYPVFGVSDEHCGLLMQELSAALRPLGKLLSLAAPGTMRKQDIPASVFATVDYFNVMSYDRGRPHHATLEYAKLSIDYWVSRGCPIEKIMLGVPFYSRSATTDPVSYKTLRERGADSELDSFTGDDGHLHGYNGRPTLRAKVTLVKERGARGIMIWNLDHDTTGEDSLLNALRMAVDAKE